MVFQVTFEDGIIHFGACLHQLHPPLGCLLHHEIRDWLDGEVHERVITLLEHNGIHLYKVNDAVEMILRTDWYLYRHRVSPELILHLLNHSEEIGAGTVHLVDKRYARHIIFVSLPPDSLALGFHAAHGAEDRHRTVEYAQRPFHLHGEVYVPRSVNEVDLEELIPVFPECGSGS